MLAALVTDRRTPDKHGRTLIPTVRRETRFHSSIGHKSAGFSRENGQGGQGATDWPARNATQRRLQAESNRDQDRFSLRVRADNLTEHRNPAIFFTISTYPLPELRPTAGTWQGAGRAQAPLATPRHATGVRPSTSDSRASQRTPPWTAAQVVVALLAASTSRRRARCTRTAVRRSVPKGVLLRSRRRVGIPSSPVQRAADQRGEDFDLIDRCRGLVGQA